MIEQSTTDHTRTEIPRDSEQYAATFSYTGIDGNITLIIPFRDSLDYLQPEPVNSFHLITPNQSSVSCPWFPVLIPSIHSWNCLMALNVNTNRVEQVALLPQDKIDFEGHNAVYVEFYRQNLKFILITSIPGVVRKASDIGLQTIFVPTDTNDENSRFDVFFNEEFIMIASNQPINTGERILSPIVQASFYLEQLVKSKENIAITQNVYLPNTDEKKS